jgi:cytochrome oxidase Cu insertion factor (SCO1/SenC/PrrC family)
MGIKPLTIAVAAVALLASGIAALDDGFKRERSEQTGAQKDALEGKPPPAMIISEWINADEWTRAGKELNWENLKGKVVLIDFWAYW